MVSTNTNAVVQFDFFSHTNLTTSLSSGSGTFQPLGSLGTGAALVPSPALLTNKFTSNFYVTLAENNHEKTDGAVALHIIEIVPDRFRGSIKTVEAQNAFDEKINLRHTGDFGGNVADVYYQWWVREVDALDRIKAPNDRDRIPPSAGGWQIYQEALGLNAIAFSGRPDITLADKLFYVRYGQKDELASADSSNSLTDDPDTAAVSPESWTLIDLDKLNPSDAWRGLSSQVPYQWAGAANSPQLQADGSRRFIPQLVMGWVKRVLDRINPYEARFSRTFDGDSPATYSSMLQEAGPPYIGAVALNSDKNAIENVGLIALYETVLARAKELTSGSATDGTNQALLLAATRLSILYELLASEAYSDAQNSSLPISDERGLPIPSENGLATANPYVFAFQNQMASLLHEELALLRGTDFSKAYPVHNRLFWNYVKGLGEAAYNINYDIVDITEDGLINEFDAATQYPMGHGDAWGHYLSANNMHYELLKHISFNWRTRAELYSLLDNVIPADYLDEKSFARIAAAKARTGLEIIRATYREAYVADPQGQWQGYTDSADPARAWGVSEWGKRAGQAALFDWMVGNALVPANADQAASEETSQATEVENLDRIDRMANRAELGAIASSLYGIQKTLDEANTGENPLGLDSDALVFDLNPLELDGSAVKRRTHFEQILDRAVLAANNALTALGFASRAEYQVRRGIEDTRELQFQALQQDIDFRNRMIEIFGTPYEGTIGAGQIYEEGYDGPDTKLYMYLDRTDILELIPGQSPRMANLGLSSTASTANSDIKFIIYSASNDRIDSYSQMFTNYFLTKPFDEIALGTAGANEEAITIQAPVTETAEYALLAPDGWGKRRAPGQLQLKLQEMLRTQIELEMSVTDYGDFVREVMSVNQRLKDEVDRIWTWNASYHETSIGAAIAKAAGDIATAVSEFFEGEVQDTWTAGLIASSFMPRVVGIDNDAFAPAVGSVKTVFGGLTAGLRKGGLIAAGIAAAGYAIEGTFEGIEERDQMHLEQYGEVASMLSELGIAIDEDQYKRLQIAEKVQSMLILADEYRGLQAEGFRLLDERSAYNMAIASKAQRNRYRDMVTRLTRTDALQKYQSTFNSAQRYAWLAAKAYEYETGLSSEDPAAATTFLEDIVKVRQMGLWEGGEPQMGNGGLAEILAQMSANFETLKAQLGINNPQRETGRISLRSELFRISQVGSSSLLRWQQALSSSKVADLWKLPEFREYCRPFANPAEGAQPGLVIDFSTTIQPDQNLFGRLLGGADHSYSSANFSTKIRSVGVWFENYDKTVLNTQQLSTTPRVYLVPVGNDMLRIANSQYPEIRSWKVIHQRIPVPFTINQSHLSDVDFIPSIHSLNGSFMDLQRFGDFRAYPTLDGTTSSSDQMHADSRLVGRSLWNTRWLLIIPGASLSADPEAGLQRFVNTVTDIELQFETYSNEGI